MKLVSTTLDLLLLSTPLLQKIVKPGAAPSFQIIVLQ